MISLYDICICKFNIFYLNYLNIYFLIISIYDILIIHYKFDLLHFWINRYTSNKIYLIFIRLNYNILVFFLFYLYI